MPNCSSSSINVFDWATGVNGCYAIKKRNLLDNLQVLPENLSPTPTPPPFQDFISLTNTKKRTHNSLSISSDISCSLPHQTPSPSLDHSNQKYAKIRARPLYNFKCTEASIWTQSTANSPSNNFVLDANIVNKYFAKVNQQTHPNKNNEQRSRSSSLSTPITRPFQILDKSSQITYDVTMRHLLQLLSKTNSTLDDVLHGIDTGNINIEWLQCVQRLNKTLNKQFLKHPEDKIKLENHSTDNLDQFNLVEQFFLKLLRLPDYNLKLKCYHYRDELQPQLLLLNQSIDRLMHGIDSVLHHAYLPGIVQLLCFLYNSVSNRSVPGLDLISFIDALNSPTNQSNKTVAHVLVQILAEYDRNSLLKTIDDQTLISLKNLFSIRYEKLYTEIREIYQEYQTILYEYSLIKSQYRLPICLQSMLSEAKIRFANLFQQETLLKKGEHDLAAYFCSNDLTIDTCLSIIGQFVDKLRQAHSETNKKDSLRKSTSPFLFSNRL